MDFKKISAVWLASACLITFILEAVAAMNSYILRPRVSFVLYILIGVFLIVWISYVWTSKSKHKTKGKIFAFTTLYVVLLCVIVVFLFFALSLLPNEREVIQNGQKVLEIDSIYENEKRIYDDYNWFFIKGH